MSSIKQIRSFIMVADLKSFTNAADILYMTQPAVSSQIKTLEESIGIPLIERTDKKVELTEAGKYFYREAKEILAAYERALEIIDEFKGLHRGRLALGASTIPGEYLIPRYIGTFRKVYPGINVSLAIGDTGVILDLLLDRKIDLGVVGGKVDRENVEFYPFLRDELVLIAAVKRDIPDQIEPWDLLSQEMIVRERNSGTQMAVWESLAPYNISERDLNIVMELGSTQAVITAVAADLGIGIISKWAAETVLKAGSVKQVQIKGMDFKRDLYTVILKNTNAARVRDVFLEHLYAGGVQGEGPLGLSLGKNDKG